MQCKDIPDSPILQFLARMDRGEITVHYSDGSPKSYKAVAASLFEGRENSIQHAVPPEVATMYRLLRAKMERLIRRGLVDGCTCGCRGDFVLTDAGRALTQDRQGG